MTLRRSFLVPSSKRAILHLMASARQEGFVVHEVLKGDVHNIYINGKLSAEMVSGYANLIVDIPYNVQDLVDRK